MAVSRRKSKGTPRRGEAAKKTSATARKLTLGRGDDPYSPR